MNRFIKTMCIISLLASICLGIVAYISVGKIKPNFKKILLLFEIQTELALYNVHTDSPAHSQQEHITKISIAIQKLINLTEVNDELLYLVMNNVGQSDDIDINELFLQFKKEFQDQVYVESNNETNTIMCTLFLAVILNCAVIMIVIRKNKEHDDNLSDKLANIDRLEMYTSMTGSIAHEFRNILTVILGYSEIMLTEGTCTYRKEMITIRDLCHRATGLIAQLYHSNTSFLCNNTNISNVLQDAISMIRKTNKNIPISCCFERCSELCNTNKQFIEQIFLNLLTNAVHAVTENHTGQIHIDFQIKNNMYEINIHDTGIGIPDDQLTKIFELFYTTKGDKGTGLGLVVTSNLIKKLNGSIHVENKDWTTFTVRIPK